MTLSDMVHRDRTLNIDQVEVLRRCSHWRRVFSDAEVTCPAMILKVPGSPPSGYTVSWIPPAPPRVSGGWSARFPWPALAHWDG
jgi:hypothetical protein